MSDFNLIVSSLVLALLLPVSVAVLYALMASHMQLTPEAAMHTAALERFDSEAERAAYHKAIDAERRVRCAAVMARYRQIFEIEIGHMDPRQAEPFRRALAAQAPPGLMPGAPAAADHDEPVAADVPAPELASAASPTNAGVRRRPALWRAHLSAIRQ